MRNIVRNAIIVLVAIAVCVWAIIPPAEKLRRGKDLAGGVSLVYGVDIDPSEDAQSVLSQMIEVLKRRVNPDGALDISMVAQGNNRIEIAMPLPSDRVRALRTDFDDALERLGRRAVSPTELERTLRLPAAERGPAIEALARGDEELLASIRAAAGAYDRARAAEAAYRAAAAAESPDEAALDQLVAAAADADVAYDAARDAVVTASVDPEELARALTLSTQQQGLFDRDTGEFVSLGSPRDRALERIRERHAAAAPLIDDAIAAWTVYEAERTGLDDPSDLVRLLKGAGVLTFRITANVGALPNEPALRAELREKGPGGARAPGYTWLPIQDISSGWYDSVQELRALQQDPAGFFASRGYVVEERDGVYYMLLHDEPGLRLTQAEGDWSVTGAFEQPDELGRPAIGFRMDTTGASLLGDLTGPNVGRPMAVILDDKVYTAPSLNSQISASGVIQGSFSREEIRYIKQTLAAGSLAAKLTEQPLQIDTTSPELGADNLRKGLFAGVYAFIAVAVFMILYYFTSGFVAFGALACNAIFLLGLMALGRASFTMPGIAGIVLTFGMAVDSNVLIYERIREELAKGANLKAAARIGFQRASSSIIDGNVTNLIVCLVLYYTGTTEIKGFAVTLGLGVLTTLFCAMVVTRLLFSVMLEVLKVKRLPMLPSAIPVIGRILEPNIDWMKYRFVFYAVSVVLAGFGAAMMVRQGGEMLDNEFRGGTAVTIRLKAEDPDGPGPQEALATTLTRQEAEDRLRAVAAAAPTGSDASRLITADVIAVNPEADQITSSTFLIKTVVTDPDAVARTVIEAFEDVLDVRPSLAFSSITTEPVVSDALGDNIRRAAVRDDVSDYVGGVAIVVEGVDPPVTLDELNSRIASFATADEYSASIRRTEKIVILEGDPSAVTAFARVVGDPDISFFADEGAWRISLAENERALVTEALETSSSLAGIQSFSPAIAKDFVAQATVSVILSILGILVYVWVRFTSVRYSLAAVVADVHDAFIAIGFIAVAEVLYEAFPSFAATLGLQPFKIDLAMIAAVLTVLGYSLNDSIVVMDRVRENRGKLAYASREVVNLSLNQTFSRTIITSGTTLIACLILYIFAGQAIRGFAYAIFLGVLAGTYSSISITATMVWSRRTPPPARPIDASSSAGAAGALVTT